LIPVNFISSAPIFRFETRAGVGFGCAAPVRTFILASMVKTKARKSRLRYQEVADALLGQIANDSHPVGAMLPSEIELCQQFNVSRYTVREALRRLGDMGVVSRRQGSGTLVQAREPAAKYVQTLGSLGEFLQYPEDTRLHILSAGELSADKALATRLDGRERRRWFHVAALRRRSDGLPLNWSDIYLLPKYAPITQWIGKDTSPVHLLIDRHFDQRPAKVEIDMFAGKISAERAAVLEVAEGTPALVIRRRYADATGKFYEISVSEHPSGRYTFSMQLERAWGARD
jgi:GntR family transcriptional regulator